MSTSSISICIIDDDELILELLHSYLKNRYKNIVCFSSAIDALREIRELKPHLVLTDLLIPDIDGITLAKEIKTFHPETMIVAISSYSDTDYFLKAFDSGFENYLLKPVSKDMLLNVVQKCTEKIELQKTLQQYKNIVSSSDDLLLFLDNNGIPQVCNKAFLQNFNMTEEALLGNALGTSIGEYFKKEDSFEEKIHLALRGEAIYFERWFHLPAGNFHYKVSVLPHKEECSVEGVIINMHDNTLYKEAVNELQLLRYSLEETVRQKIEEIREKDNLMIQQDRYASMGEMLTMIAHQWRQPLNTVSSTAISLTMLAELDKLIPATLKEKCHCIEVQCQQMSQTINDFMNFFKPASVHERFNFFQCLEDVEKMIMPQFANHNILLHKNVDTSLTIEGFKNELEHVLLNLLSNSKDAFATNSSDDKAITITAAKEYDSIIITVEDNAGGIPQDIMHRIFDPYYTTKEEGKGTGIGLYMARTIIEKSFNGTVTADNIALGACFSITLPL